MVLAVTEGCRGAVTLVTLSPSCTNLSTNMSTSLSFFFSLRALPPPALCGRLTQQDKVNTATAVQKNFHEEKCVVTRRVRTPIIAELLQCGSFSHSTLTYLCTKIYTPRFSSSDIYIHDTKYMLILIH